MKLTNNIALIISATILLSGCSTLTGKSAAGEKLIPETEIMVPEILITFEEGDTLWEFAERTTGDGANWEQLKVVNQIKDETNIDAGIVLVVPHELALESLKATDNAANTVLE